MQTVAPQNRHVKNVAHEFLRVHWDRKKPLLLGYSGGPDSKALLYTLLECGVTPHLAHVDHGWREESAKEAEELRKEALLLGCPFHGVKIEVEKSEEAARKARLKFFATLMEGYDALLLAHQADDLAETVLKRVLEGAHLSALRGMEEVSVIEGIKILRPFLSIKREEIVAFLAEKGLTAICDLSNFNPIYLRAKMRGEILPFLTKSFGKEVSGNLTLLGARAAELNAYLDEKIQNIALDGKIDVGSLAKVERRHLLQKMARQKSFHLSKEMIEILLGWMEAKSTRSLCTGGWKVGVKGRFLLVQKI